MRNHSQNNAYTKNGRLKHNTILTNKAVKQPLIKTYENMENRPKINYAELKKDQQVINKIIALADYLRQEFKSTPHQYDKPFNMRVELNQPKVLKSPRILFRIGSGADGQKRISKTLGRVENVWSALLKLANQEAQLKTFEVLPETAVNDVLAMYSPKKPSVPMKRPNPARRKSHPSDEGQ